MPPTSNLPKLLRPIQPPHRPDHHDHTGHSHPYPRPSLYITSVAMALLSMYVLLLLGLAIFTMWRVSRKHFRRSFIGLTNDYPPVLAAQSRGEEEETGDEFGRGLGFGMKQKGMVKSRVVVREVNGQGGPGREAGNALPNTHLSHEDLDDTEETALLSGDACDNPSYGMTKSSEAGSYHNDGGKEADEGVEADDELFAGDGGKRVVPRYGGQETHGKAKAEGRTRFGIGNQSLREPTPRGQADWRNVKVPEGLQRAAQGGK